MVYQRVCVTDDSTSMVKEKSIKLIRPALMCWVKTLAVKNSRYKKVDVKWYGRLMRRR